MNVRTVETSVVMACTHTCKLSWRNIMVAKLLLLCVICVTKKYCWGLEYWCQMKTL